MGALWASSSSAITPLACKEVPEVIQQRAFIDPKHPIDQLVAEQATHHPRIVTTGDLPTQPLRQVLRDLVGCLFHGPPSSLA
jgi:hypothetical protein